MQKEKTVRTYQRKSKNGKVVTVHSYKAKYDAAEEARKEMAKRAGAGEEFKKKKSAAPADLGFTADEFKIWANDLDVEEAKRIDKILVKKYGEKAVQKLADEINAGNSRTHKAVFARLTSESIKKTNEPITRVDKGPKKQPMPKFNDAAIQRVADSLGVSKQTAQKKMYAELQRRLDSGMSMGKAISTPLFPDTPAKEERKKTASKKSDKVVDEFLSGKDVSKQLTEKKTTKTKLQAKIGERKGKFIVSSSGKPLKNAVNAAIAKAKREAYIEKSPYKDVLKRYSGDALVVALQRRGVEYKKAVSISNRLQALKAQERSVEFRGK